MSSDDHSLAMEGVKFFGEMSASISHEIKNVLAIMNENAGLLNDLVLMHEKGMPLSPERLVGISKSLGGQIRRADNIVKKMNRFSHSADHPKERVDLNECVRFMVDLTSRLISMKGACFEVIDEGPTAISTTHRFYLEQLIWRCMIAAMDACTEGSAIRIHVEKIDAEPAIRFSGLSNDNKRLNPSFPSSREKTVAHMLGARISVIPDQGEIIARLPGDKI